MALVDFAQQSLRTRGRAVADVANHGSLLLFEHQAREIQGLRFDDYGAEGNDEIWLSVPHPPNPEVAPQAESPWLSPWLNVGAAVRAAPQLATEIDGAALIAAGTHRDANAPAADIAQAADPAVEPRARVRWKSRRSTPVIWNPRGNPGPRPRAGAGGSPISMSACSPCSRSSPGRWSKASSNLSGEWGCARPQKRARPSPIR